MFHQPEFSILRILAVFHDNKKSMNHFTLFLLSLLTDAIIFIITDVKENKG